MKGKLIWPIFWVMVAVFIIEIAVVITGIITSYLVFIGMGLLLVLGVALLITTIRAKVTGKPKAFLILTGASVAGMPVFAVLHNLVYGMFIALFGENFWGKGGDEPVLFILAVIVCPIGFLVGAVVSVVLNIKNKRAMYSS